MRRTRKAINNLSLRKNIIRKAPIQSGIKHVCASHAQNDALEATLSQRAGTALRSPHREVQSTKERDINASGAREQGVLRVLQHPLFFSVANCKLL